MKKSIIIALLVTFCSTFIIPQKAMAGCVRTIVALTLGGAGIWAGTTIGYGNTDKIGEATLIGAGLGAVGGLIICAIDSAKESPPIYGLGQQSKAEKPGGEWKLAENSVFLPDTQADRSSSYPNDHDKQAVAFFSFKVEF